jgi:formylglycine-generating enzyme required for sulfatase activity
MHIFVKELENLLAGKKVSASSINTEQLREQMTGTVEIQPTPSQTPTPTVLPSPVRRKWALPAFLISGGGALVLLLAIGGCYLLFSNTGILPAILPATQPTSYTSTSIPPSPTAIPPTETVQPVSNPVGTPTNTSTPTATPLPEEIKDSKNVPMRLVPAGEFTMGSDDTGDAISRPAHKVFVEAFYIDKYEVTNEMYDACAYAVECRRPRNPGSVTRTTYYSNPVFADYPVLYVDWSMAVAYCEWRGARLPTEAEWEKAARGTDERIYPWGDPIIDCSYANLAGCVGDTTPVDQYDKSQSPYGVYGMAGNVWEWTSTLSKLYPYNPTDGREDLSKSGKRIARGGSWHTFGGNAGNARTDTRFELDPGYYGAYVGFRCARSVDQVIESP